MVLMGCFSLTGEDLVPEPALQVQEDDEGEPGPGRRTGRRVRATGDADLSFHATNSA